VSRGPAVPCRVAQECHVRDGFGLLAVDDPLLRRAVVRARHEARNDQPSAVAVSDPTDALVLCRRPGGSRPDSGPWSCSASRRT
jgi:hypothetical protein